MSDRLDRGLAVAAATELPAEVDAELRSTLRELPVLIHNSGLAAACAYLLSRADSDDDHDRYWKTARAVLTDAAEFVRLDGRAEATPLRLLDRIVELDDRHYVAAERRARSFAVWLSRIGTARATASAEPDRPESGAE